MHFGIDYGSKLAGTTVITWGHEGILNQRSVAKKVDADAFILQSIEELKPTHVFLDAPLSLPKAYFGDGDDFFYREGDKALRAMSPMFLGGLTARAMKLKSQIVKHNIEVIETYPGALVRHYPELEKCYSKKDKTVIPVFMDQLYPFLEDMILKHQPTNLHQVDSIIAWISGMRHLSGRSEIVGNKSEGQIIY